MNNIVNYCIQISIGFSVLATEFLAAQRYSDDDWLRLRKALSVTSVEGAGVIASMVPMIDIPRSKPPTAVIDSTPARVLRYACALGAPPALILAVAEQESNFSSVQGAAGEQGVMQVMPDTARVHGLDDGRLLELDYGIYAGIVIFLDIMRDHPVEETALAVYNGGPAYAGDSLNSEARSKVQRYIAEVLRRKSKYAEHNCHDMS